MKKMNKKGFTIVELVIVIAVIAILAAVLIPTFSGVVDKANSSAALQTARSTLTNALNMSSNATLAGQDSTTKEYRTIIVIDGYAYGYTGNTLEAVNYPGYKGEAKLKIYNKTANTGNYNAILISADNVTTTYAESATTTEPSDWATTYTSYYSKDANGKYTENASATFTSGLYKATYTLSTDIKKILEGDATDTSAIAVTEMTGDLTITKSVKGIYTITDSTSGTALSAKLYLNSDFAKDVVVFTTFGE